jgi:hypothetical protein
MAEEPWQAHIPAAPEREHTRYHQGNIRSDYRQRIRHKQNNHRKTTIMKKKRVNWGWIVALFLLSAFIVFIAMLLRAWQNFSL